MLIPSIISLPEFKLYPQSQIGLYAKHFFELHEVGATLPRMFVIPVDSLKAVASYNDLEKKVNQLLQTASTDSSKVLEKVQKIITSQVAHPAISKAILALYNFELQKAYAKVMSSTLEGFKAKSRVELNILGEANLYESILEIWANEITLERLDNRQLFPTAILIQAQVISDVSGIAFTRDPLSADKTALSIYSQFGETKSSQIKNFKDRFKVNINDFSLKDVYIGSQEWLLGRAQDKYIKKKLGHFKKKKPTLSNSQAIALARQIYQIKLNKPYHLKLFWSLCKNDFIIHRLQNFERDDQVKEKLIEEKNSQAFLIGTALQAGLVSGKAKVINHPQAVKEFVENQIAVIPNFTHEHLPILKKACAIIVENTIHSVFFMKEIRKQQIPTIIKCDFALKRISNGQELIVDASSGKIYIDRSNQFAKKSPKNYEYCSSKIYEIIKLDQNREPILSKDLNYNQRIFIDYEYLLVKNGFDPEFLIKSKKRLALKRVIIKEIKELQTRLQNFQLVFTANNLDSSRLAKLLYHQEYQEHNPFLGFRGSIKTLYSPATFDFLIEILTTCEQELKINCEFVLPFTRDIFELKLLSKHLEKLGSNLKYWFEVKTPQNLLELAEYLKYQPIGLILNIHSLFCLYTGLDPSNQQLLAFYHDNTKIYDHIFSQVKKTPATNKFEYCLKLAELNHYCLGLAHEHHFDSFLVKSNLASVTKQAIITAEGKYL